MEKDRKTTLSQAVTEDTIAYTGTVIVERISTKTGKRVGHAKKRNNGTSLLFRNIAQCIAGVNTTAQMPKYLKGFVDEDSTNSTFSAFVPAGKPVVGYSDTDSSAWVAFEFLVPFTQLSAIEKTNYLCLYNKTGSNAEILAQVDISGSPFEGDGESNYLVTWTIKINNVN